MKTALVHDWLISSVGGAENTLKEMFSLFPSPIYTLLANEKEFNFPSITTSFIQKLPQKHFRKFLPLFPLAIEQFDLSNYDVILSSSHCVAKGVLTHAEQTHICYCHTPMRYAWDCTHEYLREEKGLKNLFAKLSLHYIRNWDVQSSNRVDHFIANSKYVARRIRKTYGRESSVIYPPVDTTFFTPVSQKDNYYITASRLVPYKRVDLIIEAFAKMPDLKLIVVGDGPEMAKLRKMATPNIELLGYQSNDALKQLLQKAKAYLFAALEDFGISPIEAMACATPVIALNKGGTAETVLDQKTGLLFPEQTAQDIAETVRRFEKLSFDPTMISAHAATFSAERFRHEFHQFVHSHVRK